MPYPRKGGQHAPQRSGVTLRLAGTSPGSPDNDDGDWWDARNIGSRRTIALLLQQVAMTTLWAPLIRKTENTTRQQAKHADTIPVTWRSVSKQKTGVQYRKNDNLWDNRVRPARPSGFDATPRDALAQTIWPVARGSRAHACGSCREGPVALATGSLFRSAVRTPALTICPKDRCRLACNKVAWSARERERERNR